MTGKRLLRAAVVVAFGALIAGGVLVQASGRVATTLNVRFPSDFPSLDPMVDSTNAYAWAAVNPGYDRFVAVKPDGKGFGPYLATSWKQTPKSILFHLRRDAKCSDGHVLTAVDMLNSIKRFIFVPKRGGSPASTSGGGWGPGPYHLQASNKHSTMSLRVDKPWGPLLGLFSALPVICPAGLAAVAADPHALETRVYGSGPYTLVSAEHGNQIVYKLRKDWKWGPPGTSTASMADNLVIKIVVDNTTAANLLATGGLDLGTMRGPDVARSLANSSLAHKAAANWFVGNLGFNMRANRPFALGVGDAFRHAIQVALDPNAFNDVVYGGRGHVTPSFFRTNADCFDKKTLTLMPKPSISAAKTILSNAGYTVVNGRLSKDGKAVPQLNFVSSPTNFENGGAYVLSVLQQLGFNVQLNDLTTTYGPTIIAGNFDLTLEYANRPSPEAGTQMNSFAGPASPAGANIASTGEGDPLYSKYYTAGLQNIGPGSCRYLALVQELNIKGAYSVPMASPDYDMFYRKATIASMPTWPPEVFGFPWFYVKVK